MGSRLTETAYQARKAINWGILIIISYIILKIFWGILVAIFLVMFPPKAPPPNHAFGKLPALSFPNTASQSAQFVFRLETITGSLPVASSSAAVYFMPKNTPNLLARTRIQDFARQLKFNPSPTQQSKYIYKFNDDEFPLRVIRFDMVSENFFLRYAYEQDNSVFNDKNLPSPQKAVTDARSFLKQYERLPDDMPSDYQKPAFLRYINSKLEPATSLSTADAISVNFYRQAIRGMRSYTPDPKLGLISFVYSGSHENRKQILEIKYAYWPVDYETYGTYELKNPQIAWQELQDGTGYIASYPTQGNEIVVRDVNLGYYDTYESQTYFQPIYVFEGDYGFVGYVSAIDSVWVEEAKVVEAAVE